MCARCIGWAWRAEKKIASDFRRVFEQRIGCGVTLKPKGTKGLAGPFWASCAAAEVGENAQKSQHETRFLLKSYMRSEIDFSIRRYETIVFEQ